MRVHAGQLEAARWYARWLRGYMTGARDADLERIWTLLLAGGRRGGKSDLGIKALSTFNVAVDGAMTWAVSPTEDETLELRDALEEHIPRSWYRPFEDELMFEFVNGSRLLLLSGYKPSTLKRGRVDMVLLNEAQNMSERAFAMVRAATADSGGLTIIAANPPDKPIGRWVDDFYLDAKGGKKHARVFDFFPDRNPHIVMESLEDMKDDVDELTYKRDVRGEFGHPIGDRVLHTWSNTERGNVRPTPEMGDCSVAFFRRFWAGRSFEAVVGMDFQISPHLAATVYQAFLDGDPDVEDPEADPLLWVPAGGGIVVEGDEDDLVDALEAFGLDSKLTAVIADATGEYQDAAHKPGRRSWDMLRRRGWTNIYKPDPTLEKNPLVLERVAIANARIRNAQGKRRLFSDPANAQLNRALSNWEMRNGFPARRGHHCHMGDATTYPLCTLYPRARRRDRVTYKGLGKSTRRQDLKGW